MNRAYVRVSTVDQHEDRQVKALEVHSIDKWYIEKVSGKNADREQLQLMLSEAENGDTIYIHDFSRLARSTKDLLGIVEELNERNIRLVSNKESLDTSTPTGKLLLTMIGAIAEFERTNMLERQREGIQIAKEKGAFKNCGRKAKQIESADFIDDITRVVDGTLTRAAVAIKYGVSRPTLNKMIERIAL